VNRGMFGELLHSLRLGRTVHQGGVHLANFREHAFQRLSEKVLSNVPKVDSDVMRKAKWVEKSLPGGP
jgi:hypothetical protein